MANLNNFLDKFFAEHAVTKDTLDHFSSVPWTNKYLSDSAYEPVPTYSRILKSSGEDYFFSRTINTPTTLPHYLTLRLRDYQTLPISKPSQPSQTNNQSHKQVTTVPEKPDCIFLLHLGEKGIDGHPGVMHGGMVGAILDETMGLMVMLHHKNVAGELGPRDLLFTANLNTSYRAKVPTPGNVIVRTWLTKREPRKWYSKGQIVDEHGVVLSEGDGLWLITKAKI